MKHVCTFGLLLPLGGRAHMTWWGQETHSENEKPVLGVTRRVHHRSQGCSAGCKDGNAIYIRMGNAIIIRT